MHSWCGIERTAPHDLVMPQADIAGVVPWHGASHGVMAIGTVQKTTGAVPLAAGIHFGTDYLNIHEPAMGRAV